MKRSRHGILSFAGKAIALLCCAALLYSFPGMVTLAAAQPLDLGTGTVQLFSGVGSGGAVCVQNADGKTLVKRLKTENGQVQLTDDFSFTGNCVYASVGSTYVAMLFVKNTQTRLVLCPIENLQDFSLYALPLDFGGVCSVAVGDDGTVYAVSAADKSTLQIYTVAGDQLSLSAQKELAQVYCAGTTVYLFGADGTGMQYAQQAVQAGSGTEFVSAGDGALTPCGAGCVVDESGDIYLLGSDGTMTYLSGSSAAGGMQLCWVCSGTVYFAAGMAVSKTELSSKKQWTGTLPGTVCAVAGEIYAYEANGIRYAALPEFVETVASKAESQTPSAPAGAASQPGQLTDARCSIKDGMLFVPAGMTAAMVKDAFTSPAQVFSGQEQATGSCRTGMTLQWEGTAYTLVVVGDCNGSGTVNTADILQMQKQILGEETLPGACAAAADLDGDGKITCADVILLEKML